METGGFHVSIVLQLGVGLIERSALPLYTLSSVRARAILRQQQETIRHAFVVGGPLVSSDRYLRLGPKVLEDRWVCYTVRDRPSYILDSLFNPRLSSLDL